MNIFLLTILIATLYSVDESLDYSEKSYKKIYIPEKLKTEDLDDTSSLWSWDRMDTTENLAIFWQKGFGKDLGKAPDLQNNDMQVDLEKLKSRSEYFFKYYRDSLEFVLPGSKSETYKMMIMLQYTLQGTAYGGDYDDTIGAIWVSPQRLRDNNLNCVAHELAHSFQYQLRCDGDGCGWGGGGIYEMAAQWMLWQVNPDWQTDENYHLKSYVEKAHKAFLHKTNIYHSPYVLEYWATLHGKKFIAELFREGRKDEDPVMTYKRITQMDQDTFCDEMFDACRHFINWDFDRVRKNSRKYANMFRTILEQAEDWYMVPSATCPENYGFNVIPMDVPEPGTVVKVRFEGIADTLNGEYNIPEPDMAGWRYGFVYIDENGNSKYGKIHSSNKGVASFRIPEDIDVKYLNFVVMGAPKKHWVNPRADSDVKDAQWPYRIKLYNTKLKYEK